MRLKGKVVVVTGSTRGIGRAIAEACGREGAKLVICSRKEDAVSETCAAFKKQGYQVTGIVVDVTNNDDLNNLLAHARETWGKIDVWINNAGLSTGYRYLGDISVEEIREIVDVNLTATMMASKLIISYFKEQGRGILINMSGRGGNGEGAAYMVPYSATKAAVTTLTRSLAAENKSLPLSIHTVIPGMVETDFYQDIKVSPELKNMLTSMPYVLNAFGVPLEKVGDLFVKIAAQQPGRVTGKKYNFLKGFRLIRGIMLMVWYRATGKIK